MGTLSVFCKVHRGWFDVDEADRMLTYIDRENGLMVACPSCYSLVVEAGRTPEQLGLYGPPHNPLKGAVRA
jgi:hypothetical protein